MTGGGNPGGPVAITCVGAGRSAWFVFSIGGAFWQPAPSKAIVMPMMITTIMTGPDRFRANDLRKAVFKIVEVLAAFNLDGELSVYSLQLFCAGVGNDGNRQVTLARRHRGGMLKDERSPATFDCAGELLDRHITRRTCLHVTAGEHLAFAGAGDVAAPLLVKRHAAHRRIGRLVILRS